MNIYLISEYVNRLKKSDITYYAEKQGISLDKEEIEETFYEYYCTSEQLVQACTCVGLAVQSVLDGETFCAPTPETQRLIFVTKKE